MRDSGAVPVTLGRLLQVGGLVGIAREFYNEELGVFNGESLHLDGAAE
jgi:hypothetical protein